MQSRMKVPWWSHGDLCEFLPLHPIVGMIARVMQVDVQCHSPQHEHACGGAFDALGAKWDVTACSLRKTLIVPTHGEGMLAVQQRISQPIFLTLLRPLP